MEEGSGRCPPYHLTSANDLYYTLFHSAPKNVFPFAPSSSSTSVLFSLEPFRIFARVPCPSYPASLSSCLSSLPSPISPSRLFLPSCTSLLPPLHLTPAPTVDLSSGFASAPYFASCRVSLPFPPPPPPHLHFHPDLHLHAHFHVHPYPSPTLNPTSTSTQTSTSTSTQTSTSFSSSHAFLHAPPRSHILPNTYLFLNPFSSPILAPCLSPLPIFVSALLSVSASSPPPKLPSASPLSPSAPLPQYSR